VNGVDVRKVGARDDSRSKLALETELELQRARVREVLVEEIDA